MIDHSPKAEELQAHPRMVQVTMKSGFPATRTPLATPIAAQLIAILQRTLDAPMVVMPTEGGSLPLYVFEEIGIPFVGMPTSNYDCNQHTNDENLELQYLFRAIDVYAGLMAWSV